MLKRLITEIHRRSLWQVLAIFLATGWGVLQVIDVLIQHGIVADWVFRAGLVLLLFGLPIVLATAFVQEGMPGSTPESSSAPESGSSSERRGEREADVSGPRGTNHRLFTWRNAILGGVAAFALLGIVAAGYVAMRTLGMAPGTLLAQGVLEKGAPIILSDFESASDAELGGVVTRALRIDLLQSSAIRVVDRDDLDDAISRMQLAADAPVTAAVARQLAEREGYAAVIAGDVATAGSGYVLTASILAGDGFRLVAGFRETARNDDELVDAIERLSRGIRDKVGESLRSVRGGPSLARVTTASLPALRAYTRGSDLDMAGDMAAALEHYERAVALDSTFAMAYRKIAVTLSNLNVRPRDAVRAARRTWELRDRLPEFERHIATAAFHERVSGEIDASRRAYEQAFAIDSSDIAVRNQLANLHMLQGRFAEGADLYAVPLRVRPVAALWANLARARFRMGDVAAAHATAQLSQVRKDFDAALATLDAIRSRCPACGAHIAYEMARTSDDKGDAYRATTEYERSLAEPDPYRLFDSVSLPHTYRRLAELYDASGDNDRAIEYYARFIELWKDADAELQPGVRRAQDRVTALLATKG